MSLIKLVAVDVVIFLTVLVVTTGGCLEAKVNKCRQLRAATTLNSK